MTKHTFKAIAQRTPVPGDLIRNMDTGNFINIVLAVSEKTFHMYGCEHVAVRSVRYGKVNGGDLILLNGQRSRSIMMPTTAAINDGAGSKWQVVEEYVKADNEGLRAAILKNMRNVDTVYHG